MTQQIDKSSIDLTSLTSALLDLARSARDISVKRDERLKVTKERFNVFTALWSAHREVQLHSRFISYLLDANAGHDCARLFLDLFLKTLRDTTLLDHNDEVVKIEELLDHAIADHFVRCKPEEPAGEGRRVDILIEFKGHRIAIENKVWAAEQESQIADYATHFRDLPPRKPFVLLYLTRDGKKADTAHGTDYIRISYETHIRCWINKCLEATYRFIGIKQVLQQYRNVVNTITGNTMESEEMKELTEFIKTHPVILAYTSAISESISAARYECVNLFVEQLRAEIRIRNPQLVIDRRTSYEPRWLFCPITGALGQIATIRACELAFQFCMDNEGSLDIGFRKCDLIQTVPEEEKDRLTRVYNSLYESGMELGRIETPWWPSGRLTLIPAFFSDTRASEMLNEQACRSAVKHAAEEILAYIKAVDEGLQRIANTPN